MRTGYNTPKANVSVASLLVLNLRDSHVEDNVRKRPLPLCNDPTPLRAIRVGANKVNIIGISKLFEEKR